MRLPAVLYSRDAARIAYTTYREESKGASPETGALPSWLSMTTGERRAWEVVFDEARGFFEGLGRRKSRAARAPVNGNGKSGHLVD